MARPKIKINWQLVEEACRMQCTQEEIASLVGCSVDTLVRHSKKVNKMSFADFFKQKRNGGKASLRRNQWLMAKSNPTMAIWLGKQYLEQKDQQHVDNTSSDGSLNITFTNEPDKKEE